MSPYWCINKGGQTSFQYRIIPSSSCGHFTHKHWTVTLYCKGKLLALTSFQRAQGGGGDRKITDRGECWQIFLKQILQVKRLGRQRTPLLCDEINASPVILWETHDPRQSWEKLLINPTKAILQNTVTTSNCEFRKQVKSEKVPSEDKIRRVGM